MEFLFELLGELIVGGSLDAANDNTIKPRTRIIFLIFVTLVYGGLGGFFLFGVIRGEGIFLKVLCAGVVILFYSLLFMLWYKFFKAVKKQRIKSGMIKKHFEFNKEDIAAGKYTSWDLIQPLWYTVSIYDGYEVYLRDSKPFTVEQRRIFALHWYNSEVCNGGHDQFFSNSTGIVWKDAIDGMRMIGASKTADNFEKAINMFGTEVLFDRDKRNDMLDKLSENPDFDDFEAIDTFYYNYGDMEDLMNQYVKNHPSEFVINGDYDYCEFPTTT